MAQIDTFVGVAAATMYRGEGWRFMQLGRFIERAQLLAALLLAQLNAEEHVEESSDADWTGLLRLCHAFEIYNRRFSVAVDARHVLDLLVTDPLLPDSLGRSLDRAAEEIAAIGPGPDARSSEAAPDAWPVGWAPSFTTSGPINKTATRSSSRFARIATSCMIA